MWLGVGTITMAMIIVASTSFFAPPPVDGSADRDPRVGVLLVVLGCIAQGIQCKGISLSHVMMMMWMYVCAHVCVCVCVCVCACLDVFEEKVMQVGAPPLVS